MQADTTALPLDVLSYVDLLEAALADSFVATYERQRLDAAAKRLQLPVERRAHIHEGYFIALAVQAWADGEITWDDEARLTMVAVALGISTHEAVDLIREAYGVEAPVDLSGLQLAPGDRICFVEPLSTSVKSWNARACAAGLSVSGPRSARWVVTCNPNDAQLQRLWAVGVSLVAEWAFEPAFEELEARRRRRGLIF